ncbi:protein of unknown function [Maridesulfovibrio hydrothermalis AM13 = DSM 14728]|uniref:Uncharacterized protein n=1 Tax=Maridesulfovibrio hydrothermalis AM13 = DSM 14728 TaxID=1121451 RepID=L0R821_9BACT|nr:protein of unknown function [Maridesulfovibrio hydrothermalis AM13 = DSM 14728]
MYNQLEILPDWNLVTSDEDGHIKAVFNRINPVYSKKD